MHRASLLLVAVLLTACGSTVPPPAGAPAATASPAVTVVVEPTTPTDATVVSAASAPPAPGAAPATEAPAPAAVPAEQPAVTDPGAVLRGRSFTSTAVHEDGRPRPLVDGTVLEVAFETATMRWQAGCNVMGADVTVQADVLDVGPVAGTAAGCDRQREAQDVWLAELFGDDPRWALAGGRLTLTRGGTVVELVER